MHEGAPRPGLHLGRAVERRFEKCRQGAQRRRFRTRGTNRRHHARTNLSNGFFPGFGAFGNISKVCVFKREVARLRLVVVTGDAVFIDHFGGFSRLGQNRRKHNCRNK